jgi:hypothetical protein
VVALELVGHPEQRAKDGGAIIAGQVDYTSLDDEAAEFDEMPRAPAAFDLPRGAPSVLRSVVGAFRRARL